MANETDRLNALLEAERPELLGLDKGELYRPKVGRERARDLTTGLRREFEPLLSRLAVVFSEGEAAKIRQAFDLLPRRVDVYHAAELAMQERWTPAERTRYLELARLARENDRDLFNWAWALFSTTPAVRPTLDSIYAGRGTRDDAEDVVREVKLLRERWTEVEGKSALTVERLDQAERDATEMLRLLHQDAPDTAGSPADVRRRAYTAWHENYTLVADAGRYLERTDPAAERRFPHIFPERTPAAPPAPEQPGQPQ